MAKIEVLDVIDVDGVFITVPRLNRKHFKKLEATLLGTTVATFPTFAYANADNTFHRIWDAVMIGLDYATALIIVFSGVSWMLGHRTKSIEILIGACCGYILARHAVDIRDLLKTI